LSHFNEVLLLDASDTCTQISSFIEEKRLQLNRDGVIIGYSGGLDSTVAAYLTVKEVGREKVTLLNLPDKDSKERHRKDAKDVANLLGGKLIATSHTHTDAKVDIDTNSSVRPPYLGMVFCQSPDLEIDSGLIALFGSNKPTGWTRFSALDRRFPRGAST